MKRVFAATFIAAGFFVFAHRPAQAMVEFCPASLHYERVGPESEKRSAGDLYGFDLSALGPRTITSATLAFDTSGGWYTTSVPAVAVAEKDRHYTAPWVKFTRRDYVSPVLYVRFPDRVTIAHAWVTQAQAQNDGAFGWQAMGMVDCDPSPSASPAQRRTQRERDPYKLDPEDQDRLSAVPSDRSLILAAVASRALESTACDEPFRDATVTSQAEPAYPDVMRDQALGPATTAIEVGIAGDGTLSDAWVWGPSGYTPFDESSLRAARLSKYKGARAYCRAVPGLYDFRVTFDPQ